MTAIEDGAALVLRIPEGARIPDGATFYEGSDDGYCRLVRADGTRCGAARTRAYGLCSGHAGLGGVNRDPSMAARLAGQSRREKARTRMLLGITPRTAADPRQLARLRAHERAEEIARALIDDPLDRIEDAGKRQAAVIAGLEQAWPSVRATIEAELPEDEAGMQALGWEELRKLEQAYVPLTPALPEALDPEHPSGF